MRLTPPLGPGWIAAHLPHQGAMCLVDQVLEWSADGIRCIAGGLDAPHHPLRESGRVPALAGIEYAAQAMALHGALLRHDDSDAPVDPPRRPRLGYLASVRQVELHTDRLDTLDAPLTIEAQRLSGDSTQALYTFTVRAGQRPLLSGRAAVVMDADARGTPD